MNGNRQLGDAGVVLIAHALVANASSPLTRIELAAVGAGDHSSNELALAFRKCHQLRQLRFAENRVGFLGAVALAEALQQRIDPAGDGGIGCSICGTNATGDGDGDGAKGAALLQQLALARALAYDVAALHPSRLDSHQVQALVSNPGATIFGRRVHRETTAVEVAVAGAGTAALDEGGGDGRLPFFLDLTHNLLFKSGGAGLIPYYTQPQCQGEGGEDEGEVTDTSMDDPFDFGDDDGDY
jgi:hypothetical protein